MCGRMRASHPPAASESNLSALDEVRTFVDASMAAALAIILGNLRLLEMPNGGSISFAALPLLVLALTRGTRVTAYAALCAGLGHAMLGGTIIHPIQLLLDYGAASMALALAGIARGASVMRQRVAIAIASLAQLACFTVSGAWFFLHSLSAGAIQVSAAYNAVTVIPELVIACVLAPRLVEVWCRADPIEAMRLGLLRVDPGRAAAPRARRTLAVRSVAPAPANPASAPRPSSRPAPRFELPRMRLVSSETNPSASQSSPLRRGCAR